MFLATRRMGHAFAVTYIFSFGVKPVSDVCPGSENDWVAQRTVVTFRDEKSKVKHFVEEADPAVSASAVKCHFFWGVEATKLVRSWDDFSLLMF